MGGAAVVNFWAGKLCFLSLNVVVFLCFFLWLVVLFVVLIFVIKSSGKLCTFRVFVDEVVRFVVLMFVIKSSGKLCTFCAFLLMKLWSVPNIKSIRCVYFFLGLLLCKNDQGSCAL